MLCQGWMRRFSAWEDGQREALLFALEEETDPKRFSIHRLGHYCLDLAELCETERVVPVVIFLRRSPTLPSSLSDNLVARLNLMNMDWSPADKVRLYARAIRGPLDLDTNPRRHAKYVDFIDSYAALTDNEGIEYEQRS